MTSRPNTRSTSRRATGCQDKITVTPDPLLCQTEPILKYQRNTNYVSDECMFLLNSDCTVIEYGRRGYQLFFKIHFHLLGDESAPEIVLSDTILKHENLVIAAFEFLNKQDNRRISGWSASRDFQNLYWAIMRRRSQPSWERLMIRPTSCYCDQLVCSWLFSWLITAIVGAIVGSSAAPITSKGASGGLQSTFLKASK